MKKIVSMTIVFLISLTLISGTFAVNEGTTTASQNDAAAQSSTSQSTAIYFSDVPVNAWYASQVYQLAQKGILCGVGNNKFAPGSNISIAECIKVVVTAMGYTDIKPSSGFWANSFISKAKELGIVKEGEYPTNILNTYTRPATRPEIAMFISRAMTAKGETFASNYKDYASSVLDYRNINTKYQDDVLKVYSKGIMCGYDNKNFGYNDSLKRAEISSLVMRFLDESQRTKMPAPVTFKDPNRPYKYDDDNYYYNAFYEMYPDKAKRTSDGSVIMYMYKGTPSNNDGYYAFSLKVGDVNKNFYTIALSDNYFTSSDKEALKNMIKLFFPTSYENVFSQAMNLYGLPSTDEYKYYKANLDGWTLCITKLKYGLVIAITK